MTNDTPSFQIYQQAFTAYIRDPSKQQHLKGVPKKRMNVYKELVFNNLFESVSACFPVAQEVLGKRTWLALVRRFLREHAANSPLFRQIPEEFVSYLSQLSLIEANLLPPYLASLCHYECVELQVSSMTDVAEPEVKKINPSGDLLARRTAFTPSMRLLNYDYAVHTISAKHKPKYKVNTYILVYRNTEHTVKFVELNLVTYSLIELMRNQTYTAEQALTIIANERNQPSVENLVPFGLEILNDLRAQGIILGTYY